VGLELHKKTGDAVKTGEIIATVHYNDSAKLSSALPILKEAWRIGPKPPGQTRQLIWKIIEGAKP
jgi:thymidine phosphorylase